MAKKRKALNAKDVVKDPALIDAESGPYALLNDRSTATSFDNMLTALEIVASRGWQVVSMSTNLTTGGMQVEMYVLVQRVAAPPGDGTTWPYDL